MIQSGGQARIDRVPVNKCIQASRPKRREADGRQDNDKLFHVLSGFRVPEEGPGHM